MSLLQRGKAKPGRSKAARHWRERAEAERQAEEFERFLWDHEVRTGTLQLTLEEIVEQQEEETGCYANEEDDPVEVQPNEREQ